MSELAINAALLAYVALVLLLKAALVRRESRFGRSLACLNCALALAYGFALAGLLFPALRHHPPTLLAIRLAVAGSVTWALWELLRALRGRRR